MVIIPVFPYLVVIQSYLLFSMYLVYITSSYLWSLILALWCCDRSCVVSTVLSSADHERLMTCPGYQRYWVAGARISSSSWCISSELLWTLEIGMLSLQFLKYESDAVIQTVYFTVLIIELLTFQITLLSLLLTLRVKWFVESQQGHL